MLLLSESSIGILGLGLIGGSIARSLRHRFPTINLIAHDVSDTNIEIALRDKTIDACDTLENVAKGVDILILALPPLNNIEIIDKLPELVNADTVITDVSSIKSAINIALNSTPISFRRNFVLGHPLAGSEQSGYSASSSTLFYERNVILTPNENTSTRAVGAIHRLWHSIGANVIGMSVCEHDEMLAATSHLPHLLSYTLVNVLIKKNKGNDIFRYAAGGFADFSRLASSDPALWAEIFLTNASEIEAILDAYIKQLTNYKDLLLDKNKDSLAIEFAKAKTAREYFMEKHFNSQSSPENMPVTKNYVVNPSNRIKGSFRVPGDKSISHRAIILGSIAEGITTVRDFLEGEDTLNTLAAFREMGVTILGPSRGKVVIYGVGLRGLQKPRKPLNMGNSGTAMRLMAGILSAQSFSSILIGDESLSNRPMQRISEPLAKFGAKLSLKNDNFPPLSINAAELAGIHYEMKIASAQVKSCLLLAGLYAKGVTKINEPVVCRDHTERMLAGFGYPVVRNESGDITIEGEGALAAIDIEVPGDISSAAFFMVAAAISEGSAINLLHVGLNPTRTGIISLLNLMNTKLEVTNEKIIGGEPVGDIRVTSSNLEGIAVPSQLVPLAIDEFPIFCIAAACATGTTTIRGAEELRVKESDRIQAMAEGLTALGIKVKTFADGLEIEGGPIFGGRIKSYSDHRIAMAFSIAALKAKDPIFIEDCNNVATSFPGFVDLANSIGMDIKEISDG